MAKYIKRPIIVEATQWFKMGDHPAVQEVFMYGSVQYVLPNTHTTTRVCASNWIVGPNEQGFYSAYSDYVFKKEFQEYMVIK